MSLAEDLRNVDTPKGPRCTVGSILDDLADDDRDEVVAAIADPAIPSSHIARTLTNHGHRVNGETMQRHTRGDCRCP